VSAATAVGYRSLGVELDARYFRLAERAIPALVRLAVNEPALDARARPLPARARP